MERHLTIVSALQIGFGILGILVGGFVFVLLAGIGVASNEEEAIIVLSIIGSIIGSFLFIVSVPAIIGGIGLFKRKNWGRILVLVMSVMELIIIPFGTVIGAYCIWVLVQEDTVKLLN